ncbi:MAG: ATP-grasp domain-containing protein [Lachnospiraceae bacterium]|nr:ATP-grasp domain-containing protein [Lachnospiraceae bacterium]
MEKKIGVVIGASRDAIHTIEQAKDEGVYVVALDGNPNAAGFEYADKSINVDISNLEKVCEEIEKIKPDFVIPVPIGRYLTTTGYVNEKYGLKGIKYQATVNSTDKYFFHKKLKDNGLRNIEAFLINENTEIDKINIPYPAIIKPRYGSGSRDVYYVNNDMEKEEAFHKIKVLKEDFIIEQAVQGEEYGFDGAVINNELKTIILRKKVITSLPERQAVAYISIKKKEYDNDIYIRINNLIKKVLEIMEYNNCLIHADLIITNEEIFVIEISPRPSGHNLHNAFIPICSGIDMAREYIKFLLNRECCFESDSIKKMQIKFFDFNNVRILKVPTEEEVRLNSKVNLILWNCNIAPNDILGKVTNGASIMGRGFFIVEGVDEEDLIKQSNMVLQQFQYESVES